MAVLRICKYPEKVLQTKSKTIDAWTPELTDLVRDMFETMYAVNGVGLAANQIGIAIRLAVIDVKPSGKSKKIVLINPKIIEMTGEVEDSEGCLSLPGIFKKLARASSARVRTYSEKGLPLEIRGRGLLARALQHEIDHLDGKVFIQRLPLIQKVQIRKEVERLSAIWEHQTSKEPISH